MVNALSVHVSAPQLPVCLCGGKSIPTEITTCILWDRWLFCKFSGGRQTVFVFFGNFTFILHEVKKWKNVINVFCRQNICFCRDISNLKYTDCDWLRIKKNNFQNNVAVHVFLYVDKQQCYVLTADYFSVVLSQVSVCSNVSGIGTPSSSPRSDGTHRHSVSFTGKPTLSHSKAILYCCTLKAMLYMLQLV